MKKTAQDSATSSVTTVTRIGITPLSVSVNPMAVIISAQAMSRVPVPPNDPGIAAIVWLTFEIIRQGRNPRRGAPSNPFARSQTGVPSTGKKTSVVATIQPTSSFQLRR